MRPMLVVIDPPGFHLLPRIVDGFERMNVETLIPQTTVERFDVGILIWLARWTAQLFVDTQEPVCA